MKNDITLLIHGPFSDQWIGRISNDVSKSDFHFHEIVVVVYKNDLEKYQSVLSNHFNNQRLSLVECKDLVNPGFFNVNRQLHTVKLGLENILDDNLVVKLRNDQTVDFNALTNCLANLEAGKLLTTNCFTRSDRLYHPSDMLVCGRRDDLLDYYSCKPMNDTHLGYILRVQTEISLQKDQIGALKISPESYLFRNYLSLKKWPIKETQSDSLAALSNFFKIVNSWDIGLRWKTKRTPFLSAGSIILPYHNKMRPFKGGPIEKGRCLNRHELESKRPSLVDTIYIVFSWLLFSLNGLDLRFFITSKIKYRIIRALLFFLRIFPYFIVSSLIKKLKSKSDYYKLKERTNMKSLGRAAK